MSVPRCVPLSFFKLCSCQTDSLDQTQQSQTVPVSAAIWPDLFLPENSHKLIGTLATAAAARNLKGKFLFLPLEKNI